MTKLKKIEVLEDGCVLGNGELTAEGEILEFSVHLSEDIFDVIETAIETGDPAVRISGHTYSWNIDPQHTS